MGLCSSAEIGYKSSVHNETRTSTRVSSIAFSSTPEMEGEILTSSNLKSFLFIESKTATNNFHPSNLLGEGGFGCVYKGYIDERLKAATPERGICVAVKKLNKNGCQGQQEWLTEIKCLGQFRHPNVVKLIGYCLVEDQRLLVYEFMPKGSLEKHLYRRTGVSCIRTLSWNVWLKIALGAAKGLAFLHNKAEVIHRDFKTSNILLDSNYNAKISGFGMAKDGPIGDNSHVSTWIIDAARSGYAAPEHKTTGHLTTKVDVYSFGVVLLELITGRPVQLDNKHYIGGNNLVDWAMPYLRRTRSTYRVLDPRLEGKYAVSGGLKAAKLAAWCLRKEPHDRPNMEEVRRELEQIISDSMLGFGSTSKSA